MVEPNEQIENVVFQALVHPMRRTILRIIASRSEGVSYSELLAELSLSTGNLNYHLSQLAGLTAKHDAYRYVLTPLGKKALNQLNLAQQERSPEDEKYVEIAEVSQKSSLQPALRMFLLVGLGFSIMILLVWSFLAYVAITEGAPTFVYVVLSALFALGLGLLYSLVLALKKTPDWVRRLERRFLGPA